MAKLNNVAVCDNQSRSQPSTIKEATSTSPTMTSHWLGFENLNHIEGVFIQLNKENYETKRQLTREKNLKTQILILAIAVDVNFLKGSSN